MNYYDRLTSLLLGEQNKKLGLDLRRVITTSRTPHSEKSAAGAQGNTRWAREGKPYLRRYGGGENVAHDIPQTLKQFSRSMQAPSAADARASLGAAGRRRRSK